MWPAEAFPTSRPIVLVVALATALASTAFLVPVQATAEDGPMTVTSFDGTAIDILVCKPDAASAESPAPVLLQSHGWGGSRAGSCGGFGEYLEAGIGVVSISQRGFGASGGEAHVHDPDYEGRDNIAVIDTVAGFSWVKLDGPNDPVLGAMGGSYGGGYQLITALTETAATGKTRFNALAPEITWYDLVDSLAPQGVVRSVWVSALYAAGSSAVHSGIHQSFAYGMATGFFPDGTVPGMYDLVSDFHGNSPVAFVENDVRLDVPMLVRQGMTDTLFNFNQAWNNFEQTLTPEARAQSRVIGYNGGHVLVPSAVPPGLNPGGDPCSAPFGGFGALRLAFYRNVFFGESNLMPESAYSLATVDGTCVSVDGVAPSTTAALDLPVVTTTGAGAPQQIELASGPLVVAGIPQLRATLTTGGADARVFFALSVGTSPLDAAMIDNQMIPLHALLPTLSEPITLDLAGVAAELDAGEKLYLTVSPVSDMSAAHGSRTPGIVVLTDVEVGLPVV